MEDSPLLTIFSAPKAFKGHVGIIQQNAIRSWLSLRPKPRVILFCNEDGAAEVLRGLEVELISDVETNSYGTPLVSSMFALADARAASDVVAFVSADIILTHRIMEAGRIAAAWSRRFLLVAQRHDDQLKVGPLVFAYSPLERSPTVVSHATLPLRASNAMMCASAVLTITLSS